MRRRLIKNRDGANFLAAIVMLIGIMLAVIIAAMVFYPFADAGQDAAAQSESFTIADVTGIFYCNLSVSPDTTTPDLNISSTNAFGSFSPEVGEITRSGKFIQVDANVWGAGNTTAVITFNSRTHSSVGTVITYALIVFAMLAIIPLIIIGGVMLSSLGFFGSGSGKP